MADIVGNKRRRGATVSLPSAKLLMATAAVSIVSGVLFVVLSQHRVVPAGAPRAAASCDRGDPLHITADPAVVTPLRALAREFSAALQAEGRACVRILVRPMAARDAVAALQSGWDTARHGQPPDVWVPDTSAWMEVYRIGAGPDVLPDDTSVLARSPLVFAMPAPMAAALPPRMSWRTLVGLASVAGGWDAFGHPEWGDPRVMLADPLRTTEGLLTLLSLEVAQDRSGPAGATDAATTGTDAGAVPVWSAVSAVVPDVGTPLRVYLGADDPLAHLSGMPLLERQVWQFNRGRMALPVPGHTSPAPGGATPAAPPAGQRPEVRLAAVYPAEGALGADYPYVVMEGDWVDGATVQAAEELEEFLLGDRGQRRFEADGFRRADNAANPVHRSEDGLAGRDDADMLPPAATDTVREVRESWSAAAAASRTLLLVDVSGSMFGRVPGTDQSRLDATVAAATRAIEVLPRSSHVGLWEFSADLPGGASGGDYRELVGVGPLDEDVGGQPRAVAIADALHQMTPQNDTALNDTLLAAYTALRSTYAPGERHTIVLLTDGRNDVDGGTGDRELIARLTRLHDPARPVRVVTVAYGEETDIAQMEAIAEVTGGQVLASPTAGDLDAQLLAALAGS